MGGAGTVAGDKRVDGSTSVCGMPCMSKLTDRNREHRDGSGVRQRSTADVVFAQNTARDSRSQVAIIVVGNLFTVCGFVQGVFPL